MAAVMSGDVKEIHHLLSSGAHLNSPGRKLHLNSLIPTAHSYPLIWAVYAGNSEVVQLRLDSGENPNVCCEYVDKNRVCWLRPLCEAGRPEILTMLLDAGAEVNAKVRTLYDTETTLLRAAHFQPSFGYLLIERSADVNIRDESGRTALFRAIDHHHYDLAARLIEVS